MDGCLYVVSYSLLPIMALGWLLRAWLSRIRLRAAHEALASPDTPEERRQRELVRLALERRPKAELAAEAREALRLAESYLETAWGEWERGMVWIAANTRRIQGKVSAPGPHREPVDGLLRELMQAEPFLVEAAARLEVLGVDVRLGVARLDGSACPGDIEAALNPFGEDREVKEYLRVAGKALAELRAETARALQQLGGLPC
jgi:hypothetical protein